MMRFAYLSDDKGRSLAHVEKAKISARLRDYLPREISEYFFAYIAKQDGAVVSTVHLTVAKKPANTSLITGKVATVLNVFTLPSHRRTGIATHLLKMMIEDAKEMQISYLDLSASEAGKSLYEKLGFYCVENTKYTKLKLRLIEMES